MDKDILIVGGTGELGGRIIKASVQQGAQVKAIVHPESKNVTTSLMESYKIVSRTLKALMNND